MTDPPDDLPDDLADGLIERHVESVEMRDAARHSSRVKNRRGPKQRRRAQRNTRRPRREDADLNDDPKSGLVGALGLLITIVFAAVGSMAILVLFGMRSSHRVAPRSKSERRPLRSSAP